MKLFKILLFLLILPTQTLSSSPYLMDPMPNKKPAPDFVLVGLDGEEHSLTELRGKLATCSPLKFNTKLLVLVVFPIIEKSKPHLLKIFFAFSSFPELSINNILS